MARPRLEAAKREKIELRVNTEQKAALTAAAQHAGMPTATWILKVALDESRRHELAPRTLPAGPAGQDRVP